MYGDLRTPYRHVYVSLAETYRSDLIPEPCFGSHLTRIEIGLHSFKEKDPAEHLARSYSNMIRTQVVKCIIPKGAKYAVGTFNNGCRDYNSIASDRIIYSEILQVLPTSFN